MGVGNRIPQAFSTGALQQQVQALERRVEELAARAAYVGLERITPAEGGTIDENVGKQLTETVQKEIVIDGENLAPDALDNKEIVGSSIRSEGIARAVYGDGTVRESNVSATLGQRVTPWSLGEEDAWPGLWLEGDPIDEPGYVPPELPAGISVADAWGGSLVARSARRTESAAYGSVSVTPTAVNLNVFSAGSDDPTNTTSNRAQTHLGLGLGRFAAVSADGNGVEGAAIRHNGDGVLRLDGRNGVLVNGEPLAGGTVDSGWRAASYLNSWEDYGRGFAGLQYSLRGGVLYLRGTIKGGVRNSIVSVLPENFRPILPAGVQANEFPIAVVSGSTLLPGTMYAYTDGRLLYNAVPSTWVNIDRVAINTSFPL